MKKLIVVIALGTLSFLCEGQECYLNYFVDEYFLEFVYPRGYDIKSGGYDYRNRMYDDTKFSGISGNWEIDIETDKNGYVRNIGYYYIKYPEMKRLPSTVEEEIINMADQIWNDSRAKVEKKELLFLLYIY